MWCSFRNNKGGTYCTSAHTCWKWTRITKQSTCCTWGARTAWGSQLWSICREVLCLGTGGKTSLGPRRANSSFCGWLDLRLDFIHHLAQMCDTVTFCPQGKVSSWLLPLSHLPDWKRRQCHTCWEKRFTGRRAATRLQPTHTPEKSSPHIPEHPTQSSSVELHTNPSTQVTLSVDHALQQLKPTRELNWGNVGCGNDLQLSRNQQPQI